MIAPIVLIAVNEMRSSWSVLLRRRCRNVEDSVRGIVCSWILSMLEVVTCKSVSGWIRALVSLVVVLG